MSGDFEKGWRGKDDWWLWRKGIYWSGLARGQLDEFEQLWQRRVVMREGERERGGERTGPVVLRVPLRERVGVFLVRVSA
jgi:hypothetical protein